jgi:hypothetical protein
MYSRPGTEAKSKSIAVEETAKNKYSRPGTKAKRKNTAVEEAAKSKYSRAGAEAKRKSSCTKTDLVSWTFSQLDMTG